MKSDGSERTEKKWEKNQKQGESFNKYIADEAVYSCTLQSRGTFTVLDSSNLT